MVVLVSPGLDEARLELWKALEARMMVTMVANCTISYSGRTGSDIGEGGRLIVKAVRPSPLETLNIEIDRIDFLSAFRLKDEAEFILHSSEEEMQKAILAEPDLIEQGLRVID